jgi:ADP-ribose pyrophosphatase YjhB (NUDIX family)
MLLKRDLRGKYKKLLRGMSVERREIVEVLFMRKWFLETETKLQKELMTMPESWNRFLQDLANKSELIDGVIILSLAKLARGNFMAVPVFNVMNTVKKNKYTYEYASWKFGPYPGSKGVVLVETKGEITHVVLLKGPKFATGSREVYDTPGGFIEPGEDGKTDMKEGIKREASEELGVKNLEIKKVYDLGRFLTDTGMTNNNPHLYAAVISSMEAKKIKDQVDNLDPYELKASLLVLPISSLKDVVIETEDAYFLAVVAKLDALGVINLNG